MPLFLAVLVLVARPLAVLLCTLRSTLEWPERTFLAVLAPRGIVAAAVASVFALRMRAQHLEGADTLVPVTFATIIGTVTSTHRVISARDHGLSTRFSGERQWCGSSPRRVGPMRWYRSGTPARYFSAP